MKTNLYVTLLSLALVGCNVGSSGNGSGNVTPNMKSILTPNANGIIGWNSNLQMLAPQACYEYNIQLINSTTPSLISKVYTQGNISEMANDFGMSMSVGGGFFSSPINSATFNSMYMSNNSTANLVAAAGTITPFSVNVATIALSPVGEAILNQKNQTLVGFEQQCGDSVVQSGELFTLLTNTISIQTNSNYLSVSVTDKSNISTELGHVSTEISNQYSQSGGGYSVSGQLAVYGQINLDPESGVVTELSNSLNECMGTAAASGSYSGKEPPEFNTNACAGIGTIMGNIVSAANEVGVKALDDADGPSFNYATYFDLNQNSLSLTSLTDPSLENLYSIITTKLGNNNSNPVIQGYLTAIQANETLYNTLDKIGNVFDNQIAPQLAMMFGPNTNNGSLFTADNSYGYLLPNMVLPFASSTNFMNPKFSNFNTKNAFLIDYYQYLTNSGPLQFDDIVNHDIPLSIVENNYYDVISTASDGINHPANNPNRPGATYSNTVLGMYKNDIANCITSETAQDAAKYCNSTMLAESPTVESVLRKYLPSTQIYIASSFSGDAPYIANALIHTAIDLQYQFSIQGVQAELLYSQIGLYAYTSMPQNLSGNMVIVPTSIPNSSNYGGFVLVLPNRPVGYYDSNNIANNPNLISQLNANANMSCDGGIDCVFINMSGTYWYGDFNTALNNRGYSPTIPAAVGMWYGFKGSIPTASQIVFNDTSNTSQVVLGGFVAADMGLSSFSTSTIYSFESCYNRGWRCGNYTDNHSISVTKNASNFGVGDIGNGVVWTINDYANIIHNGDLYNLGGGGNRYNNGGSSAPLIITATVNKNMNIIPSLHSSSN